MSNPFTYAELHTQDPDKAKRFYLELFQWKVNEISTPMGPYAEIKPGDGIMGGLMKTDGPSRWVAYVKVEDLAASTKRAKTLGAKAICELQEVPDQGSFSLLIDPTGAPFGLWQPKQK
jgi:uncharacterized protein